MFYVIACLPVVVGATQWVITKKVVWWEWAIGSAIAFLLSVAFHVTVARSLTADYETWSGQIVKATHHPRWVEQYQVAVYRTETYTNSDGTTSTRQVFSHMETRYRTHPEHWTASCSVGGSKGIAKPFFEQVTVKFESLVTEKPYKGGFYSGDRNVYVTYNRSGFVYPTTTWKHFENRVKVSPTVFSHVTVPETVELFPYPKNGNWRVSNRVIDATNVMTLEWDRLNARLGPTKKVNIILIYYGERDSGYGQWQEAAWKGGKKNDLVLCYGGPHEKPTWTYVFGWTERADVKRNLETILLEGPVDTDLIEAIESEVVANYELVDWSKFDYIAIEPPLWSLLTLIGVMVAVQSGFYAWAILNRHKKAYLVS